MINDTEKYLKCPLGEDEKEKKKRLKEEDKKRKEREAEEEDGIVCEEKAGLSMFFFHNDIYVLYVHPVPMSLKLNELYIFIRFFNIKGSCNTVATLLRTENSNGNKGLVVCLFD